MARRPDRERDGAAPVNGDQWPSLAPGTSLMVVKLAPDGSEVTRYPGVVLASPAPAPWLGVAAQWVNRRVDLDGLAFIPGDTLHEYFSPNDRFNVFAVFAPTGRWRGWYANVTYPARLNAATDPPTLSWHDLYVDVVVLPDGRVVIRDEDELAAAGLAKRDPALHTTILATRDTILEQVARRAFPFHEGSNSD